MILLNFSHPPTAEHLAQIGAQAGQVVARVIEVPVQLDLEQPLASQVTALVDQAGLKPEEWQTLPLLVNLPGYAPGAAVLLAELHGRIGHFPSVLWIRPVPRSTPTRFDVAGLLNLQAIRDQARQERSNAPDNTGMAWIRS